MVKPVQTSNPLEPATPLAADFDPPSRDAWMALVEKTLKGAPYEKKLRWKTREGLSVEPLYTPEDGIAARMLPRPATGDAARPWDLRTLIRHPDPATANTQVLEDLENGAASVLLRLDPTGRDGIAAVSAEDLATVLDGVMIDLAPVGLDAGALDVEAAGWLAGFARSQPGAIRAPLAFNMDPVSAFAASGTAPGSVQARVARAAALAKRLAPDLLEARFLRASGQVVHEAGGGEAQELGVMAAAAVLYVKALVEAGFGVDEAFARVTLGLAVDGEYFTSLAKLRAARAIWGRITAASGVEVPARIEARSSARMLSKVDPWVNLLRLTAAGFAGAVGGADVVVLAPFTDAIGHPGALARRQARNTQLVLMEESHLGRVADPAAGAWALEQLTDGFARAGWAAFQAIEQAGGLIAALEAGIVQERAAATRAAIEAAVAKRQTGLIGVSEFPNLGDVAPTMDEVDPASFARPMPEIAADGPASACTPLAPMRLAEPYERLREAARGLTADGSYPKALLVTLGTPADYTARLTFTRNLLAAGGIDADIHDGTDGLPAGARLAVLCSSDARYAEEAAAAAAALKAAGAAHVWLAGRPGELEAALTGAGVSRFLAAGMDALALLTEAHAAVATPSAGTEA